MRFRRFAPAVLIGSVAIVVALTAFLTNRLFSGLTSSVEKSQFDTMQAIIEFNLKGALDRGLSRAEMLSKLPSLQEAFKAGDRARLLAEFGPMFKEQKEKYGVDQMQLQLPPATTFLRFQAPESFGDDVSQTRPLVVAVMRDHVTRKAPAIGRTGPALYGIVPVNDAEGNYIGSLEVGMDFGAVLDNLKAAYGLELVLFIEEEKLRRLAPGVDKEVLDERNRVGKYLKYHATHWELMQQLVRSGDVSALEEPRRYTRTAMGKPYGVLLLPIHNAAGESLGAIAVAKDFDASRAAAGRSLIWQGLLSLFAIVILAGLILVVLRGFLLQPLGVINKGFADLAKGERGKPIEDADRYCDELAELAAHHETLRNAGAKDDAP